MIEYKNIYITVVNVGNRVYTVGLRNKFYEDVIASYDFTRGFFENEQKFYDRILNYVKHEIIDKNEYSCNAIINYKKFDNIPDLKPPNSGDAGTDLYSTDKVELFPNQWTKISTGIGIEIPEGYCGLILSRSGLRFKESIFMSTGLIDEIYRGIIQGLVIYDTPLYNSEPITIEKHQKIGQLLIIPYLKVDKYIEQEELSETTRGTDGFGSTGKF